jgi:hypothetical protein
MAMATPTVDLFDDPMALAGFEFVEVALLAPGKGVYGTH